jgi:hypothetical protein
MGMLHITKRIISHKYATHISNLEFKHKWIGSTIRNLTIWARPSLLIPPADEGVDLLTRKNGIHLSRFLNSIVPINIFKLYSSVLIKNRRIYESFGLIFIGPIYYRWYDIYLSINRWIYETQAVVRDRLYYSVNMSTPIFYSVYKSIVSICIISYAVVRNFFLWLLIFFMSYSYV